MIRWLLCGGLVPWMLCVAGVFFLIYLRGGPLAHPRRFVRALRAPAASGGTSPLRAVLLALAGTLGVGNIVGVANALAVGGAGAVFWMWVSALLAMLLKYAEIVLAVSHRRQGKQGFFGGAYYYIKDAFEARGRYKTAAVLSAVFALLMAVDALSMGCVIQVEAIGTALAGVTGLPVLLGGGSVLALSLPVLLRGRSGVAGLTEYLVPIMSVGYVILSVAVLTVRREAVGAALASVFRDAFSVSGVGGGVLGFLTSRALRVGTMRGLLSNEAGCGTAPTAHASADAASPAAQGVWGIFEVFADTIVLCTATALAVLVAYPAGLPEGAGGVMTVICAYSSVLGDWSAWFLCAAVLCFGYATVLCWADYGMESLAFLSRRPLWRYVYLLLFSLGTLFGCVLPSALVWDISDFAIASLTTVNLLVLLLLRREIKRESDRL